MPGKYRRTTAEGRSGDKRNRLQFEATPDMVRRLNEIIRLGKVQTWSEAIRTAVRVLEWILRQTDDGYSIQLVKNGQTKEVELLW